MLKALILGLAVFATLGLPVTARASILDATFNPGTGAGGGLVEQVLPQSDGKILVCGNFTSFNGRPKSYMARLNADGSVDESFHAQASYWVRNMSLQPDGKIVIGGFFTSVSGVPRNLIARLNSDGSLDSTFNPGTGARDSMAAGIDGNNNPFVMWTAVQPDGKILITGNFKTYNGISAMGFVRLNSDGTRDTSFDIGGGLNSWGRHILVMPNGQILLSGWFSAYKNKWCNRIARINPDGSPDFSFNPYFGDHTAIYSTALVANDKIIAAGHSLNQEGLFLREMARLNPDGTFDETFIGQTNEKTESAVIQSDGKVIVGGYFTRANGTPRSKLARFHPDGALDTSFGANIDNFVWSCALQADGKLLISGGFYSVDGVSRVGVARLLTGVSGGEPPPRDVAPVLTVGGATASSLTLNWTDSSTIRTGYEIQQKSGSSYTTITSVGSGTRSYTVNGLASSTQYTFRLKGNNSQGGSVYSADATGTTTAGSGGGSGSTGAAQYVGSDAGTQGTWLGTYGGEGYNVFGDRNLLPSYVTVTPVGKSDWTWQWSTQDPAALQRAVGTDRLAACWYSATSYSIDLRFTDGQAHRVSVYFLDWDKMGRVQNVQVTDGGTGVILDSKTVSAFGQGIYHTWDLSGHVKITVIAQTGNAVASGIFFGPGAGGGGGGGTTGSTGGDPTPTAAIPTISPNGGTFSSAQQVTLSTTTAGAEIRYTLNGNEPTSSSTLYSGAFNVSSSATVKAKAFASGYYPSATASATFTINSGGGSGENFRFVGTDTTTKGNWLGVYGSDGYNVFGHTSKYPSYVQVTPVGHQQWIWNQTTADPRALQTPDGLSRIASCWYVNGTFEVNLNFTDGATHRVAAYVCDWDFAGRSQTVELVDNATGAVLHTQTVSNFSGGQYLVWDLKGNVKLRFTKITGFNAVLNGLFFQPAVSQL